MSISDAIVLVIFGGLTTSIPIATHQKAGKETGQTAHIERLKNTIRKVQ